MRVLNVCLCLFCVSSIYFIFFFFFQAEDGIRDLIVTGVQTCALPILPGQKGCAQSRVEVHPRRRCSLCSLRRVYGRKRTHREVGVIRKPRLKENAQMLWGVSLVFLCIGSLLDLEKGVWLGITGIAGIT